VKREIPDRLVLRELMVHKAHRDLRVRKARQVLQERMA
jgi:hypothetical protein